MTERTSFSGTSRIVITFAALIIVVAGLKYSASLIVPFLLSAFIAVIFSPIMDFFRKKKLPVILALLLIIFIILFVLSAFGGLVATSVNSFSDNIPLYEEKINALIASLIHSLQNIGFDLSETKLSELLNSASIMTFVTGLLSGLGNALTNSLIVLFTVIFMLLESTSFPQKIQKIVEDNKHKPFALDNFTKSVKDYLWIKTIISFITGVIVTIALILFGVDYPLLWGTLAFLLNYIPTIGSFIAAVPAVLLTIIQIGPITSLFVALVYVGVNTIMGNIVEPKYMGKELGLSTLVVFLSLIFWGWVFGPVGMLLSVPLTMILKIGFENSKDTKWIAVLLGSENQYE
jgi:AI-2 transport protein TqsA